MGLVRTDVRGSVTETRMIGKTVAGTIDATGTAMTVSGNAGMTLIVGTTTAPARRIAIENADGSTRATETMSAVETETVTGAEGGMMSGTGVTGDGRQLVLRALGAEQRVKIRPSRIWIFCMVRHQFICAQPRNTTLPQALSVMEPSFSHELRA